MMVPSRGMGPTLPHRRERSKNDAAADPAGYLEAPSTNQERVSTTFYSCKALARAPTCKRGGAILPANAGTRCS
jgi:hypothetical protein